MLTYQKKPGRTELGFWVVWAFLILFDLWVSVWILAADTGILLLHKESETSRWVKAWMSHCHTYKYMHTVLCLQVPTHVSSLSLSVSLSASLSLTLFFSDIGPIGLSKRFNMYLYSILKSVKHGKTMCIHDKLYFEQNCLSCHTKLL